MHRTAFSLSVLFLATCTSPPESVARQRLEFPSGAAAWRLMRYQDEFGRIPERAWQTALEARERTVAASALLPAAGGIAPGAWVERGPNNVAGRSRSLAIDPRNPQRVFCGSVSGGLWLSTNGGSTWSLVNGWWANLSVGALTMDPGNPDTLYVGTGEGFYSLAHPVRSFNHFVRGAGVLKSTDGGQTWNLLPATANWLAVTRIAVSPGNSSLLLASRRPGGIARSTDGGVSWTDVAPALNSFQVAFDPNDGTRAVAHLAPTTVQTQQVVTSIDSGLTWQPALTGLNSVTGESSRIELCYARSAPGVVYASVGGSGAVWRSADSGRNWVQRGSGPTTSYYYNGLWVDPTNENLLVVAGLHTWRSSNGGQTFTQISNGYIMTVEPHPDVHAVFADPGYNGGSNRKVWLCTDGGVHIANDILSAAQGGAGWQHLDATMRSTQFYGAAGHGTNDVVVGGTQDNGSLRLIGASQTAHMTYGGDGGQVQIDATNPSYVYGEYVYLTVHRSSNGGNSATQITSGLSEAGSSGTANFIAPLRLDPNDPNRLYGGGMRLWRTASPRASTTWTSVKASVGSLIASIAIAPGAADRIYVGHNDGRVYRTTNGTGAAPTWIVVDDNGATNPLPGRVVTRMVVDPTNTATVYATFGGFAADNVWRSNDGGVNWQALPGVAPFALPPAPVYGLAVHPDDGNVIYAATEVGVYASDDGGAHWSASNEGPANVVCEEITFAHNTRRLVLATLGRGLWTADVARPRAVAFGSACAGHASPPAIAVDPLATARIGRTFNVLGSNLRIGQPAAFLVVGFSNTTWNGFPLPLDLTVVGLTGCPMLVSPDLFLAAPINAGSATWSFPLPENRDLLGGHLFTQALSPDPGLNPTGFAMSAGLDLTIGW